MSSTGPQDLVLKVEDEPVDVRHLYHPGATGADMPRFYRLQDERYMERVPRPPHLSPPAERFPGILYYTASGWPGVRVKDILQNTIEIDSPNDPIFAHHGWRTTVVNLEWPGFIPIAVANPMHARIQLYGLDGNHMTRLEFAREICLLLFDLYKNPPKHLIAAGCERWTLNSDSQGIRLADVVLLSVHYYTNTWVPEFYVLERRNGTRQHLPS